MAKLCICLTSKTLARDLEVLDKYRKYVDIAELRVDCLEADERLYVRRFPTMAGLPLILTIRREVDGGQFTGGEGSRISLFSRALAFAQADRRHNFAFVDLEDYLDMPNIEEAVRSFGTRIIRSKHNINGVDEDLVTQIRSLHRVGDELVKLAVMPHSIEDTLRVLSAAKQTTDINKILVCMGPYGAPSRILAEQFGSQISYASAKGEPDSPVAAPGQFDPQELEECFRFRSINPKTRIFGITGFPLKTTLSPPFFNAVFKFENLDAVYVPFQTDSIKAFLKLAEELGVEGMSVTIPHKESVLPYLFSVAKEVESIGACNTIVRSPKGWDGFNTDAQGFSGSLLDFIGKKTFKGKRITIVGAGGAARSVASEVFRLGGKALILNRTELKARDLAEQYNFAWNRLDSKGIDLIKKYADIIIQTTSVGMTGYEEYDPLEFYRFSGFEVVMDLVYKPERTILLKRASEAGCRVLNGFDMLIRQAQLQYGHFLGVDFPYHLMSRIKF
ncbi:MAG: type I 3-dehydroquinate dehydratase [Treponema sp.]|jgi:3-dehydroquinate dehydratase/shikimate dehydrogenase|nr:type I 3-dehydroquinate dehydratase [Treponema sp.]